MSDNVISLDEYRERRKKEPLRKSSGKRGKADKRSKDSKLRDALDKFGSFTGNVLKNRFKKNDEDKDV